MPSSRALMRYSALACPVSMRKGSLSYSARREHGPEHDVDIRLPCRRAQQHSRSQSGLVQIGNRRGRQRYMTPDATASVAGVRTGFIRTPRQRPATPLPARKTMPASTWSAAATAARPRKWGRSRASRWNNATQTLERQLLCKEQLGTSAPGQLLCVSHQNATVRG